MLENLSIPLYNNNFFKIGLRKNEMGADNPQGRTNYQLYYAVNTGKGIERKVLCFDSQNDLSAIEYADKFIEEQNKKAIKEKDFKPIILVTD